MLVEPLIEFDEGENTRNQITQFCSPGSQDILFHDHRLEDCSKDGVEKLARLGKAFREAHEVEGVKIRQSIVKNVGRGFVCQCTAFFSKDSRLEIADVMFNEDGIIKEVMRYDSSGSVEVGQCRQRSTDRIAQKDRSPMGDRQLVHKRRQKMPCKNNVSGQEWVAFKNL